MGKRLRLERLDEARLPLLQSWFADAELDRWIDYPAPSWYEYVTKQPASYPCMAYEESEPVGFVHYGTKPDGTVSFSYYVRPDLRGHGYGRRLLLAMLDAPELTGVDDVWCGVHPDNVASLRCLAAAGFLHVELYPGDPSMLKASLSGQGSARGGV